MTAPVPSSSPASARAPRRFASPDAAQRAAADPRASVWVNASAGSGKTTVLTQRVTRLLLDGTPPEKLLCLTFTRAGAAEMTNRIAALFSKWVSCPLDALRKDFDKFQDTPPTPAQLTAARRLFARVLECPGGLRIRTIHSFCQEILSRFPLEAGLPPNFRLIEGQELDALRAETLDELLRASARAPDAQAARDLALLAREFGEVRFERTLQDLLRRLGAHAGADTASRLRARLALDPADTAEDLRRRALADLDSAKMATLAAQWAQGSPKFAQRGETLHAILAAPPEARAAAFDAYIALFLKTDGEIREGKDIANKDLIEKYPDLPERFAEEGLRLRLILERIEAAAAAELTEAALRFSGAFATRFAARKAALGALDYDDLIQKTEALLTRPDVNAWVMYKLDLGIDHVLVDEAQDTSRAQWAIVRALTTEFFSGAGAARRDPRTLFVVGDEKQSIFSFQNADPESFFLMRDFFAQRLAEAGNRLDEIGQHTSFRSAPAILRAVDATFAAEAARAGVSREPVAHRAAAEGRPDAKIGRVELWPLIEPPGKDKDESGAWILPTVCESERDPPAELAQRIARKIKGWLDNGFTLPNATTPVRPADIMILLRRREPFASLMVRALKAAGVPVTGIDRMHLVRELPVLDLLAATKFVLLPEDDLTLAELLRSPLIGFDEEQLMRLALGREGVSLWRTLDDRAGDDPAFAAARDYLAARLAEADFMTPFAFLSRLLALPCPGDGDSGRKALWKRLGVEALDPLDELLNAAQNFGRARAPSLQNFLRWLFEGDSEIKRELDAGRKNDADPGLVRIMTVHAAKGLEAPIVFMPDTAALPQAADLPKLQWLDSATPIFLARKPKIAAALRAPWLDARRKQLEEYRRLLYVAMTRAAQRLYVCGWATSRNSGNGEGETQSWYELIAAALTPLHSPQAEPETDADEPTPVAVHIDMPLVATTPPAREETPLALSMPLPAWARQAVPAPIRAPRAVPPSETLAMGETADATAGAATPDAAFARGRIIHRLLQSLPDLPPSRRPEAVARFLAQPRHALDETARADIAEQVLSLLKKEEFSILFGPGSRAEVALSGLLDGAEAFRQVDRLCLRGEEVWIVDYKTNRPPPREAKDVPPAYRAQLGEYRALLSALYPDKKIRCFLLWTYTAHLMELEL